MRKHKLEDVDENGVIRDGGSVRVPLTLMDSQQRAIAGSTEPEDTADDSTFNDADSAYDAMCDSVSNAWRAQA